MSIDEFDDQSKIDLTGCKLVDEDMEIVISKAIYNKQCTILQLINCEITSNGASLLANALSRNRTLEQLSLWNNRIGDMGVRSLSNALSFNRNNLKKIDLSDNDITDDGAKYLAQMLKTNTILTHLTLSRNNISDKGVQQIANALQNRNRTLQKLSFTENKFLTDSSVDYFIDMFTHNRSLRKLWLNDCNLSKIGQNRLEKAAKSKKDFDVYM
jgi:Ran GTPase-activating protein (RanGAP) involved in mRNA processing and transport